MTTLQHHHLELVQRSPATPVLDLAGHEEIAPTLAYDAHRVPEAALAKTLFGFALGAILMDLMLNAGAFLVLHYQMRHLWDASWEFMFRGAFLFGLTFVGTSLLLVSLKVREERSAVPLRSKHWLVSLMTGAFFAVAVFGPGLVAERGLALNSPSAIAAWIGVLLVPVASSFWLVTRRRTRDVLAEMMGG